MIEAETDVYSDILESLLEGISRVRSKHRLRARKAERAAAEALFHQESPEDELETDEVFAMFPSLRKYLGADVDSDGSKKLALD